MISKHPPVLSWWVWSSGLKVQSGPAGFAAGSYVIPIDQVTYPSLSKIDYKPVASFAYLCSPGHTPQRKAKPLAENCPSKAGSFNQVDWRVNTPPAESRWLQLTAKAGGNRLRKLYMLQTLLSSATLYNNYAVGRVLQVQLTRINAKAATWKVEVLPLPIGDNNASDLCKHACRDMGV